MLQIIIILTIGQQYVDPKIIDNFSLIEDFEKNQVHFSSDTFDLTGKSTDRGKMIAFHSKDKDYLVFDFWLYGETGKIHATYWTDKNINFKIIKTTSFKYDKPYYEKDYKVTESTEYLSYVDNSVRLYNKERKELMNSKVDEKKMESENFFKELTKDLKIVK